MGDVNNRSEVRDFLISRRGKVTPEQVGLAAHPGTRRVPGLRRSEAAQLAGVSVEYYTQLERGNLGGASKSVLDAVARALLLDEAEQAHLFDLARAAQPGAAAASETVGTAANQPQPPASPPPAAGRCRWRTSPAPGRTTSTAAGVALRSVTPRSSPRRSAG